MEWIESLKRAVRFMEGHLSDDIGAEDVADAVNMSPFYFQKGFKIMTGYTISEYIRYRRLYLAALDVIADKEKVIDLAYKYGYDTPESFTKAFRRFHGMSPKQMQCDASKIRTFLPLRVSVEIKGGHDMDYTIVEMDAVQMIGFEQIIDYDTAYQKIPVFWDNFSKKACHDRSDSQYDEAVISIAKACKIGEYGICIDDIPEKNQFRYMIAGMYKGGTVPAGMKIYEIPEMTWAKFKCAGPLPGALQSMNTRIYKEWLPENAEYEIAAGINIEWYSMGDMDAALYESEIWIPVKRK